MSFWDSINAWGGGYAAFILPAYAVSALGLIGAVAWTVKAYNNARVRLAALEKGPRTPEEKKP